MNAGNWMAEGLAAVGALFGLRLIWLYRGQQGAAARHMRRVGAGGLLLALMISLADLVTYGYMPTGVTWAITIVGIGIGAVGYRWLMAKEPNS